MLHHIDLPPLIMPLCQCLAPWHFIRPPSCCAIMLMCHFIRPLSCHAIMLMLPSASQPAPLPLMAPLHLLIVASASHCDPLFLVDCCITLSYSGVHLSSMNFYAPPSPPYKTIFYPISFKICMSHVSVLMKDKYKRGFRRGERENCWGLYSYGWYRCN